MTQPDRCPECGAERSAGICPRCLIRLGIDGPGPGRSQRLSSEASRGLTSRVTAAAGILDTIAASIGPVPRVLLRDTAPGEEPGPIVRPPGPDDADASIRYRIDGEIARGGMGAVLKGRDPDLGRDVALKVLRDDLRENADMVRRFVEEAQIGGQLQHPGVVPIYELGTFADRRPFFAMKLVKGHTLAQLLEARTGTDDERPQFLSIFAAVAQTVAYAHARSVIHRDLKPSNVMVGSFGEVQVMDWGLAKVLPRGGLADDEKAGQPDRRETVIATARSGSGDHDLSRPGSAMGTPAYMAPEQARAEGDRVDERADVFALGSVLCEVLTGEPAFLGRSSGEILRKAALGDTADALARLDASGADAELITLAKDCLKRELEDRPRHAGAVAERMTAYLAGVQVRLRAAEVAHAAESARAEEAIGRARAERRARQFQVGLAASLLALTTASGLTFTYVLHQRQQRSAKFAQVLAEATALRDKARREAGAPATWRDALAALERAEGQGPEEQIAALRGELQAGLDEAERDASLRQALVEIRANQQDVGPDGTDSAYATAFRTANLDVDALEPHELAERLRRQPESVVIELSAFLDDWSDARRGAKRPVADWRRPLEAARLADPDPYRDRVRAILMSEQHQVESEAVKALAAAPEAVDLPAPTAALLGRILVGHGRAAAALALLRPAAGHHPGDVWVNYTLAQALGKVGPSARAEAVRYYTAARSLRPETAHDLAHLLESMGRRAEAEAVFRDLTDRRPKNARHLGCLAILLKESGRAADAAPLLDRAVAAARAAIQLKSDDEAAHFNLGFALLEQGKFGEAVAEFGTSTRLKPKHAAAHINLGLALRQQGRLDEGEAEFRTAIRLDPDDAAAHHGLGALLCDVKRDYAGAEAELRAAIRLKPDDAMAHYALGNALHKLGKRHEAIAEYRAAIKLEPNHSEAHNNLANALRARGERDEAIAEYRTAVRVKPDNASAHNNLGVALSEQGKFDEAIAEHSTAIRLEPDSAASYFNLGAILCDVKGDYTGAEAAFRTAIRLERDSAANHYNLGNALEKQGKRDEAIAEYGTAIRLDPNHAEAHCNLGMLLRGQGDYAGSLAMLRRGHELGSRRPNWHYPSAQWLADAEHMAALAPRLSALLKGDDRPKDDAERLALAQLCYDTKRHAAAARFWAEALAADPKLSDDRRTWLRYNAACAAALAGAGQGKDEPKPDADARAKLRRQALDWLKAELAAWAKVLDSGDVRARPVMGQTLQHWRVDSDLASVRDTSAVAKLPEPERAAWRSLWAEADALLARSQGGRP
jgi:serine/threonine-protein kinase